MGEDSAERPTLTVSGQVDDIKWIINEVARLTEQYDSRVLVKIEKSQSIEAEIVYVGVATGVTTAVASTLASRFTNDLYDYCKQRVLAAIGRGRRLNLNINRSWKANVGRHFDEFPDALPGWIIVHSTLYFDGNQSLKGELQDVFGSGHPLWHWKLAYPMNEGGPYIVLFAYDMRVFAYGKCMVTHDLTREMRNEGYNFAFEIKDVIFPERQVEFSELPLGTRTKHHRSLIRLDDDILNVYFRLISK